MLSWFWKFLHCIRLCWLSWVFLFFHMKLIIVLSRSVKNFVGILREIALNLYIIFGRTALFTMMILPIQEHGRSFHFLVSSSISFFKPLMVLSHRSFTSLVTVTPRYFMLFVEIMKCEVSLISLSASLSFVYRSTYFFELILYPATSIKVFINCRSSLVVFLGSPLYPHISSANNKSLTSSFSI